MSCCGGRKEDWEVKAVQRWDYINLNDFKSSSCFTPFSYAFLWILLGISIACYIADFSTMINLIFWNRFGSSGIAPPAPFGIEQLPRWAFTACIALSYVLLVYRWAKAARAMRSGGVAKSYLDPLAVRIQSIRPGKRGRGYRRFLVFAELTKSKHGTEYIALFVYFAFEAWIRIIFAEGPRNAINAYTLYHLVTQLGDTNKSPDKNVHDSAIQKFWAAVLAQANSNKLQAAVYIGMVFTIVIWVIAFIGLIVACILYLFFLWHHIPSGDGGLRGYCKRKVDKSVERIVSAKIKKAFEDEQKKAAKSAAKDRKAGLPERNDDLKRQPTVPILLDEEAGDPPPYPASVTGSMYDRQPTLPDMHSNYTRPGMQSRSVTGTSSVSYASDAPLLKSAADVGHSEPGRSYSPVGGRSASPAPPRPFTPSGDLIPERAASPGPQRAYTPAGSVHSFAPSMRGPGPLARTNTGFSDMSNSPMSPAGSQTRQLTPSNGPGMGPRMPIAGINRTGSAVSAPVNGRGTPMQPPPRSNTAGPYNMQGRQSPASFSRPGAYPQRPQVSTQEFEMQPQPRPGHNPTSSVGSYRAYRPGNVQSPATPVGAGRPLLGPTQQSYDAHGSTYNDSILDDYADSDSGDRNPHNHMGGYNHGPGSRW